MKKSEIVKILSIYNEWRRGEHIDISSIAKPEQIGEAIDAAIAYMVGEIEEEQKRGLTIEYVQEQLIKNGIADVSWFLLNKDGSSQICFIAKRLGINRLFSFQNISELKEHFNKN